MPVKRTNWLMIILVAAAFSVITLLAGKNGQIVYLFSAFANGVIGGAIALLFDLAKTYGQSYNLWFQSRCCKKTDRIRISFSYLFRICIDGKYLLVRGNRLKNQYRNYSARIERIVKSSGLAKKKSIYCEPWNRNERSRGAE
jgi:hypothetical protein